MDWINELINQAQLLHFLRPMWFVALIPTFIIYMMMRALRKQKNQSASLINDVLYSYLTQGGSQSTDKRLLWPMLSAVCLCIVAMAGPTTQKIPKPVYDVAQAKVIVLDLSLSMRSTDIAPDRLTRMSFKAIDLINANNGGEIGLIAYAGDAFVISPITSDGTNLNALIPGLSPEIMPEFGSSPDLALMKADEMLTQAGYLNGDIIWFTDGVDYDQIPMLTSLLQRLPHRVSIMSVGTPAGAPIKLQNGQLLKDRSGAIVIPKLDNTALQTLASITGGVFTPITANEQDITRIMDVADTMLGDATKMNSMQGDDWYELGPYLLIPVILITLFYARHYWIMMLCMVLIPFSFLRSPTVMAQSIVPDTPQNESNVPASNVRLPNTPLDFLPAPLQNDNQKGLHAFKNGDFDTAATLFNDPEWQAHAQYAAGDYEAALSQFTQDNSAVGQFNKANTLARIGDYKSALDAYSAALEQHPDFTEAQENKDALERFLEEQPPQQSSPDDSPSEQDNTDEQNQEQQQENQDPSDQQQNQEQQQQDDQQSSQDQQSSESEEQNDAAENNQSNSEQSQDPSDEQQANEPESSDTEEQPEDPSDPKKDDQNESETMQAQVNDEPLTPEEQEKMQRMQALMNKVPNDPGYLLKRKMELEYQQRKRQQAPRSRTKQW
ncbi:VWA domain-containing protein [Glaciecola sp. HTCC2999]|jgi:Ca-activated chloride channel homolog|uniref:VWA domain-containing protein n=1 Tax=Glaciecola sp. HTCC2999 TaxID=455436 RepID=UPI0000E11832|nr:VWA domain-containing protein [Glaciecola sp. HTCC2999]